MNKAGVYQFLIILCICFSVSFAGANETPSNVTRAYSLGEVVVSADMPGEDVIQTAEITDVDIENRNAKTLDKALELLPGIDISSGAKGIPRVNIRGFRSRHTILLLNGVPLNSTYDGQFDPSIIPTENISKIKVSYGTNSILYGQGGLAGVINIITKQGTKGFHGTASGEMDERGNHYSKANISGGNEKADFFVSVSNTDSDGFLLSDDFASTPFEDGGIRENSDNERLSLFGNIGFQMNDEVDLGLTVEGSNGEFGTPPSTIDKKIDPLFAKNLKYERTEDFDTLSAQLSLAYHPEGIFGIRAWGFTNNNKQDLAGYDDSSYTTQAANGSYSRTDETTITGGTLQTSLDLDSSGTAVVSFSGQKEEYTSDGQEIDKKLNTLPIHQDNDLDIYSAGLEYKVKLFSTLDMVMGYSHHWQSKNIGSDDDKGSYMIGGSLDVTDTTTLRASYAKKIRFPSLKQLYEPGGAGNPELTTEQSSNYEAGITQKLFWNMEMDLTFFQNNVEDYIEKDAVTDQNENNDEYQFKGIEASLTKPILDKGSVGIAYSYLETEDKSPGTEKDELQYRPTHKFTVDVTYTWDFGLTAHADFMRVAEQYYYSTDTKVPLQKRELDDYSIVNLKLEQKLYKENVFIYLGVDNLFDEDYEESYGYPQSGRMAYAGLRIKF